MAKIHKFGLANSLLDSPMATWLTLTVTGTLVCCIMNAAIRGATVSFAVYNMSTVLDDV